jgi:3-oxoacyl-[acyl-carrier protein] reductase
MPSVIVTGASRGLGLGISARLAASGFRVIAIARNETPQLQNATALAAAEGAGEIIFQKFDLMETDAIPGLVKSLRKSCGAPYGLVNNAGIGTPGILSNMQDADIETLIRLNVLSPIMLTKYVVRGMMTSGEGRIVNISSIVATSGYQGLSVYSATKSSFLGFARSLAREVGGLGITVNNVAPGFIETEMTNDLSPEHTKKIIRRSALQRMAEITDIANAVDFLLSDKARNITGTTLTVDAGNTA